MSSAISKLDKILESIDNINFILENKDIKITQAIKDKLIKPASFQNSKKIMNLKYLSIFQVMI